MSGWNLLINWISQGSGYILILSYSFELEFEFEFESRLYYWIPRNKNHQSEAEPKGKSMNIINLALRTEKSIMSNAY